MYTIAKQFTFEAAHSLPHLPEGHKCRNTHGHSYKVELVLAGSVDKNWFVVDYGDLDPFKRWISDVWGHSNLNDLPFFKNEHGEKIPTTAEAICAVMFTEIKNRWPKWPLFAVRVHETATTWAEFRP